jgi:hypothetical protein
MLLLAPAADARAQGAAPPRPRGAPPVAHAPVPRPLEPLVQRSYAVAVKDGFAYVGATVGLRVHDVRNPARAAVVGTLATPDSVSGIALAGTVAYLAAGPTGVIVADVTNPRAPAQVTRLDTPGAALQVHVEGAHLYVADGSFGVAIYDVTQPRAPRLLRSVDTRCYARDVLVLGRSVYVACGKDGLVSFETFATGGRRYAYPEPFRRTALPGEVRDLALGPGRTLYAAATTAGFHVLDVRRPEAPVRVATVVVPDAAHGVGSWGTLLAVACGEGGVHLFDLRRRQAPRLVGSYQPQPLRSANRVLLLRDVLHVAHDAGGYHLVRVLKGRLAPLAVVPPPRPVK